MRPRNLIHVMLYGLLASVFWTGCSIRPIPLDEPLGEGQIIDERDSAYYGSYYYGDELLPSPNFFYDTWQMSQYYRYASDPYYQGYAPELGSLPPDRMNIDPNPNDSYRSDETPVRHAPTQQSVHPVEAYRQSEHRNARYRSNTSFQRVANRSHRVAPNSSTRSHREKEHTVRQQLKQRSRQARQNATTDQAREAQRRKVRERAQQ